MTGNARGGRMTHEERVRHHMYETCEGIAEQSERIASLEELVLDMVEWAYIDSSCDLQEQFADRMRKLGIEVAE